MDALSNARVFVRGSIREAHAVLIEGRRIAAIVPHGEVPARARRVDLDGGLLAPGFIDLQVNGGGGVVLNGAPSAEAVARIAGAHRRFGTTGLLPTLITTDRETMRRAIGAVRSALQRHVPGVLGIHLEGPHLNPARAGVHDTRHIRQLSEGDLELLASLRSGRTLVTLAPEVVAPEEIAALARRGIIVCAGHTEATPGQLRAAVDAGLRGVTHLFNAMSQLGSREPGAVGAALAEDRAWCGIIADGHHVHPASIGVAWRGKPKGRLVLVTDAMAPVGTDLDHFMLGEQRIDVQGGRCTAAEGRLAGSCLDMASAVRNAVELAGIPLEEALSMASTAPAKALGIARERGRIAAGAFADLVLLDDALNARATWIEGEMAWAGEAAA